MGYYATNSGAFEPTDGRSTQHSYFERCSKKQREKNDDITLVFIFADIEKAYPNTSRQLAWEIFRRVGMPTNMLQRLQQINEMTTYLVRTPIGDSETYTNKRGFQEGCPSSCVAFNIVQSIALEKTLKGRWTHEY